MEVVWLSLFAISAIWLLIEYFRSDLGYAAIQNYMLIPLIALAMFFFRRFFRKRMEAREERENRD